MERLIGAGSAVWFYLSKALVPINLVFVYPQWQIQTQSLLWWLPLIAAAMVTIALWLRCHSPSAGWTRPVLFAWLYFCVSLVPILGFTDVGFMQYSLVADHYQHLAVIGVVALVAAAWTTWRGQAHEAVRAAATMFALVTVCALVFLTWRQSRLFGDPIKLYQATLERNPNCALIRNNLGVRLFSAGRRQEGVQQYEEVVRMNPDYDLAYINLGNALSAGGRMPEAIKCYQQALRLRPDSPEAHNNLGNVMAILGQPIQAIEHYQQALQLKSSYTEVYVNLAKVYAQLHERNKAIATAEKGSQLARSQGRGPLAEKIDAWLAAYRSQSSGTQPSKPPSDAVHPSP